MELIRVLIWDFTDEILSISKPHTRGSTQNALEANGAWGQLTLEKHFYLPSPPIFDAELFNFVVEGRLKIWTPPDRKRCDSTWQRFVVFGENSVCGDLYQDDSRSRCFCGCIKLLEGTHVQKRPSGSKWPTRLAFHTFKEKPLQGKKVFWPPTKYCHTRPLISRQKSQEMASDDKMTACCTSSSSGVTSNSLRHLVLKNKQNTKEPRETKWEQQPRQQYFTELTLVFVKRSFKS